jgi:hypothetical protein
MAREIWLRTNRRVWTALAVLPTSAFVMAAGGMLFVRSSAAFGVLAGVLTAAAAGVIWIGWRSRKPRLAYSDGLLEVHLSSQPLRVPIEVVECFFMGQGPSFLPALQVGETKSSLETANLIVRLAESEPDWKHRDVSPRLGQWCEGYITIRGAFCEPLSKEVAGRLNRRLVEVQRELSQNKQLESV